MTQKNILEIPCSPEQAEVVADHLLYGHELGMLPDERAWIMNHVARWRPPGAQVLNADLDLENCIWLVELNTK